ncbi:MAG: hypothetical protein ACT4OU_07820 [Hyphomicrobium sp.]
MTKRAGIVWAGAFAFALLGTQTSASAQELSEKAVRSFMDYAWSLTPQQFSKPDGSTVVIDKKKKDAVLIPIEVAREVIKVGRLSAHAQVCDLRDDQIGNHRAMMRREIAKGKWTPQQEVYISQLHLTTVMLLTGKIKLVEKDGDKEVVVDEGKTPNQTCTDEQRKKVKDLITAYVAASPEPPAPKAAAAPAAGPPAATGSTTKPAAPAGAPAAAAKPATPVPAPSAQK